MAQKIFNRFGLRRDFNLSDLPDSRTALNNILQTPSMLSTEESFTTDDLTPIFGIAVTDITLTTFGGLSGTTVVFTSVDDNGIITDDTVIYRPLIKIKTQLDSSFFSSGEPYFFGGDGPNAYYYDSNDIVRDPEQLEFNKEYMLNDVVISNNQVYRVYNSNGGVSSVALTPETANASGFEFIRNWEGGSDTYFADTFDVITREVTTINDNFWERGYFGFSEKIQLSFVSLFGGVNWKGFFKPTKSGTTSFRINTTGSSIFKFQSSDSLSFQLARYGKPDAIIMNNFSNFADDENLLTNSGIKRYNIDQINEIVEIYNDPTRQLVQVRLPRKQTLAHNDSIFIEVSEGQLNSKQYTVLSHRTGSNDSNNGGGDERELIYFFIEVTKDFNLLNVNVDTDLNVSKTGSDENLTTGNITEGPEDLEGLLCTIRYSPYKRREFKEYLNSTYHKLEIPQSSFTTSGDTLTCDEFFYNHLMINDYIYDYRKRSTDGEQGVRRFNVVGLDDDTRTATVTFDASYNLVNNSDNNDQFYYLTPGSPDTIGNEEIDSTSVEIDEVYDSGTLSDTLDPSNTFDKLVFVGRYGEEITREKTITIDYFVDKFIDYAIDWYFYLKTEDINTNSNSKIWTIQTRNTIDNSFRPLNFKFLYDINYDFFKIGDFKIFSENAISSSGTSRETGISQLTFGKPKLLSKGDQYKILYTLLPVVSTYTPPLNYNKIARSGNISNTANSRLISTDSFTNFQVGNYVIINDDNGFLGTSTSSPLPARTRVIDILSDDGIVLNKDAVSTSTSNPYVVIDHKGFVCTCLLDTGSSTGTIFAGEDIVISGQIDEIKIGMAVCIQTEPSRATYCRITTINVSGNSTTIKLDSDISNGTNLRAIIYQDKGVDISEPLREFCDGSVCGQNNYQGSSVKTKYISTIAYIGTREDSLDVRWRESSLANIYDADDTRRPHRRTYFPGGTAGSTDVIGNTAVDFSQTVNQGPSVAWWVDANVGQTIDDQAVRSNGVTNNFNLNNGTRSKRYGSMQVWARFKKTGAGAYTTGIAGAITEKYGNAFPIDDTFWPIGIAEALVRVNGDLRTNTTINNSHKYYFVVRINEKLKSVPNAQNGYTATWNQSTTATDGSTLLPVTLDLTEFSTDKWDLREIVYTQGTDQNNMRDFFGNISTELLLNTSFTNQFNNRTSTTYRDHYYRITGAGFAISQTSAEGKFLNPNSLIRDDGNGNITYELKPGEILAHIGTTGYWTHFDTLESAVDTQVAFTYKPNPIDGLITNQSANESELINLYPGGSGGSAVLNYLGNKDEQPNYMQYRNQVYEILPTPTVIENEFTGIRMINPNATTTYTTPEGDTESVKTNLQNATNALSVYTFTNTTEIKELCCPPLDTSPPFDSSEIGLSTTITYPDMIIDGSVNIRSFSANHPTNKILPIITANTSQLPVNEKLEILFGDTKYKLLIGNTIPTL